MFTLNNKPRRKSFHMIGYMDNEMKNKLKLRKMSHMMPIHKNFLHSKKKNSSDGMDSNGNGKHNVKKEIQNGDVDDNVAKKKQHKKNKRRNTKRNKKKKSQAVEYIYVRKEESY